MAGQASILGNLFLTGANGNDALIVDSTGATESATPWMRVW
jgi:hypothetical protein